MQADKLPDQSFKAVVEIAQPAEVETYLVDEIFKALGLRASSRWRSWFGSFFSPIVRGFARQAVAFDQAVAQQGIQRSAKEWLKQWIPGLQVIGKEHLPTGDPLLIAANHPGTFDSLAIVSAMPRQDIKIVAAGNPFFRSLPNVRQYLIYSTLDTYVRMATIRNALRHLQSGGALLIFPGGRLEPDPLHFQEAARQALTRWSTSLGLFLRKVPQTKLVVAINSGFVAGRYLHHPLVKLRPTNEGRQILAEFIQVIQQVVFNRQTPNQPRIIFGEPAFPGYDANDDSDILSQIITSASRLLDFDPNGNNNQLLDASL